MSKVSPVPDAGDANGETEEVEYEDNCWDRNPCVKSLGKKSKIQEIEKKAQDLYEREPMGTSNTKILDLGEYGERVSVPPSLYCNVY